MAATETIAELDQWRKGDHMDAVESARRELVIETRRRLDRAVAEIKTAKVAEARVALDDWTAGLAADSDFVGATNAEMRRRAASAYVIGRLGFASTELRDWLLAA